ncbi:MULTISPECIES: YbaB/EbfC family nucleoid-associated protein [Acinetobacter]|jgi:DNA-binding YbaB/EbfC family protein|uniref:Nucleoid-associated protein CAT59_03035 n=1 Tax=Acinetobacter pittii TaxID=48296 RepID=A0A242U8Q0_ACIPI|nr:MULTISPECIES: YbaB/EbfC family nucleoid-associated protein [Acinetobacter]EXS22621.1 DNA-binding protein, YbaB/EbfC family [Acinetobacter baumannii 573719]MBJ8470831.1 YbaB/EbfC family nucleoid-associated protein [Acinetobacter pittii]MBJ8500692.1 YbaB/EbfC family nucleoid-associated protein [Acinetobacter pittii]MBJ9893039.1 YbaB/EbfC family nucleoid-associated protein [Acinetobacter pittii]MCU4478605.1 YbaB/EbfC family nucleoid-associated protein [Acinetobacter sp. WU_MDCI_Abxd143]
MNINMLMQQAQRMQKDMETNIKKAKEELAQTEVQAEAGGGLVKVTMTGRYIVKRIEINPELLQDEPDMIEDLIAAAVNDAVRQAEVISEEKMKKANSGMGLPPGLAGMF